MEQNNKVHNSPWQNRTQVMLLNYEDKKRSLDVENGVKIFNENYDYFRESSYHYQNAIEFKNECTRFNSESILLFVKHTPSSDFKDTKAQLNQKMIRFFEDKKVPEAKMDAFLKFSFVFYRLLSLSNSSLVLN